ncbi:hypothetical protein CO046_01750 [Candidatus Peregrinibacteria bacterium CG_4_9_14_0_2_um_filter_53_11]|nr:MAG: hypothetical protein CO046_01750 [Candidatus Peregrinibacteria bacterium CG_4_9_14_0_2_um_filter_53_11]
MGYQPTDETDQKSVLHLISTPEEIVASYKLGYKKPDQVRIGMEVEKFGVHRSNYGPITNLENNGMRKIQQHMIDELGWEIHRQEDRYITAMHRGGTALTLEFNESASELSGRTHPSIHDLARELRIHQHELAEMSKLHDVVWMGIGYHPFHTADQTRFLNIDRFRISDEALRRASPKMWKEHGTRHLSIQANIDYTSEDDARRKFQLLLLLEPFICAMYAHSPLKEGKTTGYVSYRLHILRKLDRRRYGIRKRFFDADFGFKDWVDFVMRIPMIAIAREGKWLPVKNMTFAQFLRSGYEGYAPLMEDWELHSSFVYTDARIKQYIELRTCDSLPPFLIPSMQAIVKAFVYHPDGERFIRELTKGLGFRELLALLDDIPKRGMQAELKNKKLLDYCKEILEVASSYLREQAILNEKGEDESVHLQPIKDFVFVKEKSPGRWVMDKWDGDWRQNPERLIEWCSFE